METQNVKWIASLSNGETIHEGKNEYEFKENELSPWQRLLKHIDKKKLMITSLALYTDKGQRWNLPSAGNNPRFKIFLETEKPIGYKFFRKVGADVFSGTITKQDDFAVIEAVYPNYKLQIWVKDIYPYPSWSLVNKK